MPPFPPPRGSPGDPLSSHFSRCAVFPFASLLVPLGGAPAVRIASRNEAARTQRVPLLTYVSIVPVIEHRSDIGKFYAEDSGLMEEKGSYSAPFLPRSPDLPRS